MRYETWDKRSSNTGRGRGCLFVLFLGLTAVGCSSKGDVSGKVLYQGQPLPAGTVTFFPSSGEGAFIGRIQQDGSYSIEKVPLGKVQIAIQPPYKRSGPQGNSNLGSKQKMVQAIKSGKMKPSEEALKKMPPEMKKALENTTSTGETGQIPTQYSDREKSGLEYTVIGGSQTHDIQLK